MESFSHKNMLCSSDYKNKNGTYLRKGTCDIHLLSVKLNLEPDHQRYKRKPPSMTKERLIYVNCFLLIHENRELFLVKLAPFTIFYPYLTQSFFS